MKNKSTIIAIVTCSVMVLCVFLSLFSGTILYFLKFKQTPDKAFKNALTQLKEGESYSFEQELREKWCREYEDNPEFDKCSNYTNEHTGSVNIQDQQLQQKLSLTTDEVNSSYEIFHFQQKDFYVKKNDSEFFKFNQEEYYRVGFTGKNGSLEILKYIPEDVNYEVEEIEEDGEKFYMYTIEMIGYLEDDIKNVFVTSHNKKPDFNEISISDVKVEDITIELWISKEESYLSKADISIKKVSYPSEIDIWKFTNEYRNIETTTSFDNWNEDIEISPPSDIADDTAKLIEHKGAGYSFYYPSTYWDAYNAEEPTADEYIGMENPQLNKYGYRNRLDLSISNIDLSYYGSALKYCESIESVLKEDDDGKTITILLEQSGSLTKCSFRREDNHSNYDVHILIDTSGSKANTKIYSLVLSYWDGSSEEELELLEKAVKQFNISEKVEIKGEEAGKYPKADKPTVMLFSMSFCPFCSDVEESLKPVYNSLKDNINYEPHYVIYSNNQGYSGSEFCYDKEDKYCSMHGVNEVYQDIRESCAFKHQKGKYWDFTIQTGKNCTVENVESCWKDVAKDIGLDTTKISKCQEDEGLDILKKEVKINEKYSITGSPTILINGVLYDGERSSDDLKNAICEAFTNPPDTCQKASET